MKFFGWGRKMETRATDDVAAGPATPGKPAVTPEGGHDCCGGQGHAEHKAEGAEGSCCGGKGHAGAEKSAHECCGGKHHMAQ